MYSYSVIQWLFFFYLYCFGGWCVESAYVSIRTRKLTNRGFLRGPFLPIYGSGAIMMLVVSIPFRDNIVLTYLAGCVGATILEYVTGALMEKLFKVRYWDYSRQPFNFQGHVCLGTSLSWGGLTILMTEFIHVPVESLVLSIPEQVLTGVTLVLTAVIFADFAVSVKTALDLRNLLAGMERVKQEMVRIQRRLDVIIALADEAVENGKNALAARREDFAGSIAELKAGIEGRLESIKNLAQTKQSEYLESVREELLELKARYTVNVEIRSRLGRLKDFFHRDVFRSNPSMTSMEYGEELEELREQEKTEGKRQKEKETQEP